MTIPVSFEFFPPRTDAGLEKLAHTAQQFEQTFSPEFFSVTFGAGGSTQEKTFGTVRLLLETVNAPVYPHLSCVALTKGELHQQIEAYLELGVKGIVALRGDTPSGTYQSGDFQHANELVQFIRNEFGDGLRLSVAAYPEYHPQSPSPEEDFKHFTQKVKAGANQAITQYFYNVQAYQHLVRNCQAYGLNCPIIPGIMPIRNYQQLARFSNMCGSEIPRWLDLKLKHFDQVEDQDGLTQFGTHVLADLCQQLLRFGAPALHFYTLNQYEPSARVLDQLNQR